MDLPKCIGFPPPTKFKQIIKPGQLKNNKVKVEDNARTEYIYDKLVGLSKGKIILRNPPVYPKIHRVPLTAPIIQLQIDVTLEYDLIFTNGMPFLTSKICKIEFRSIERTKYSGNKTILQGVRIVIEKYQEIGFKVTGNRSNNKLK